MSLTACEESAGRVAFIKRHLGTILSLLVLLVIAVLVGGWIQHSRSAPYVQRTDNTLRRFMLNDPDYLNPILRTDVYASYVMDYCHHFLIEWDYARNENKPKLATRWIISEDGLDYTFPLRTDVRWQDDVPFDADDVMFSFKESMDPDLPVGHARIGYRDMVIGECMPAGNGDGDITADEYRPVNLSELPTLAGEPTWDGVVEGAAAVVAEASAGALRAARWDDRLYVAAPVVPHHDTVIFIAGSPGPPQRYGPSAFVADSSALLLADDGNTQPARTGWLCPEKDRIKSATFTVGASEVEGVINLRELFSLSAGQPLPATFAMVAAIVDDVQLEKLDQYTVRFHFPQKVYSNLDSAGYLRLIPRHIYDDGIRLDQHPRRDDLVGLGPYKYVSWTRNSSIVLERWEGYWGARKPPIRRIEFKIINDAVVAYQVFKKGDIDAMDVGTWTYAIKSRGPVFDAHFYKLVYDQPGYGYVGWNCKRSFFSDYRCRQAMSHLFDLPSMCKHVLLDIYRPVTGPFFYQEPAYDSSLPVYDYNIAEASRLLGEAGWIDHDGDGIRDKDLNGDGKYSAQPLNGDPNQREVFDFDFIIPGNPDTPNSPVMLSLLRNCPKVGIRCDVRMIEWALFLTWTRESNFDASYSGWVFGFEADPYDLFHSSQIKDGFNRIGFNDPAVDKMLEAARQELDKAKRTEMFREIHRVIYKLQPYTFMISNSNPWVFNRRVENVHAYGLGFDVLEWQLQGHENGQ